MAVLLLGLPLGAPLLAMASCCRSQCEPALRSTGSCCKVSELPETQPPAWPAPLPQLEGPAVAELVVLSDAPLYEFPAATVFANPRTPVFSTPLRT